MSELDNHDCGNVLLRQITPVHYRCEGCGADIKWQIASLQNEWKQWYERQNSAECRVESYGEE